MLKSAGAQVHPAAAGEEAVRLRPDRTHACQQPVAHSLNAGAFPLGEPRAGKRAPVGAEPEPRGSPSGSDSRSRLAHPAACDRVERAQRASRLDLLAHQVADSLVGGQVVVVAPIQRSADAQLLGAASPVLHVVPRAQGREAAEVVHVDLAGVARHRLGEAEHVGAAGAQEVEPQPDVGRQLRVVPGVAADVVAPHVPVGVVGVHHVAVVPEAVPAVLLPLSMIEIEQPVESLFDAAATRSLVRSGGANVPPKTPAS